jgi:glycosyltransferase involved in cell wall biosynthesis
MKKIIVHHRSSHHATRSGYAKLIDYLEDVEVVTGQESILPAGLARYIKNRNPSKYGLYDSNSARKNELLVRKLLFSNTKNTLVHYLNGERDIRQAIRYFKKVQSVATFHKPPAILEKTISDTRYLKKLSGAIAVGSNQVDFLKNWLDIDRVAYIPHGIDTTFFVPDTTKRKENTVLFVGQHLRDFEVLNNVIKKLPEVHFQVVLKKGFVKNVAPCKNLEVFSGVGDEELKTMYQQATLLFLPLTDVTVCNSLLEAMACGTPIITTDLEANRGYGFNDKNSMLVLPGKESDFVDAVIDVLQCSESRLNHFSEMVRKNAMEFDWKKIAEEVELFYLGLNKS